MGVAVAVVETVVVVGVGVAVVVGTEVVSAVAGTVAGFEEAGVEVEAVVAVAVEVAEVEVTAVGGAEVEAVTAVAVVEAETVALAAVVIEAVAVLPVLPVGLLPEVRSMLAPRRLSLRRTSWLPASFAPHTGTLGRPFGCIAITFPSNLIRGLYITTMVRPGLVLHPSEVIIDGPSRRSW